MLSELQQCKRPDDILLATCITHLFTQDLDLAACRHEDWEDQCASHNKIDYGLRQVVTPAATQPPVSNFRIIDTLSSSHGMDV